MTLKQDRDKHKSGGGAPKHEEPTVAAVYGRPPILTMEHNSPLKPGMSSGRAHVSPFKHSALQRVKHKLCLPGLTGP